MSTKRPAHDHRIRAGTKTIVVCADTGLVFKVYRHDVGCLCHGCMVIKGPNGGKT